MIPVTSITILCTLFCIILTLQMHTSSAAPMVRLRTRVAASAKKTCLNQPSLVCELEPTNGNSVRGTVTFAPAFKGGKCGVNIEGRVSGLTKGEHGFHIHTYGDMRRSNGNLAGGHFSSPYAHSLPHGFPHSPKRHWGDLGNLVAWGGGNAAYSRFDSLIRIPHIVGRAVVVHAAADKGPDYPPSGDSGPRQAHCVIGYANPSLPVF